MARPQSIILTYSAQNEPQQPEVKKPRSNKMPRMNLAEAKTAMKQAKSEMAGAKKNVTATQKEFVATPDKESGAQYRSAVSAHIKATLTFDAAQFRVENLAK